MAITNTGWQHYHLSVDGERQTIPSGEQAVWRTVPAIRSALKGVKAQRRLQGKPPATLSIQVCHCPTRIARGL